MQNVYIRVDERLIHGQVAAVWTGHYNAHRIMVIDNHAVKDDIQKMALKMACPKSVKLSILSVPTAAKFLNDPNKYVGENVLIVLKHPGVLVELWNEGYKFDEINVGNMSSKHGSVQVRRTVGVTPEDVKNFIKLDELGVKMTAQMLPSDESVNFIDLVSKPDLFD